MDRSLGLACGAVLTRCTTVTPMKEAAWVQALATVVLVCITIFYAIRTHHLAKNAKEQADAATRAATAAERGLMLQAMPLVFGKQVRNLARGGGESVPSEVVLFGFGQAAFAVTVDVHQGPNDEFGYLGPLDHVLPTVAGEQYKLTGKPAWRLVDGQPYKVVVEYFDASGVAYRTTRWSLLGKQSLSNIERMIPGVDEWERLVTGLDEDARIPM